MSVNFSTISPMSQSTISKPPAFSVNAQSQAQPAASSPMDAYGQPSKKKSHWFAKTLVTLVVVAAALGLGRKYGMKEFDPKQVLDASASKKDKAMFQVKKGIAIAGDYINNKVEKFLNLFKKKDNAAVKPEAPAAKAPAPAAATPAPAAPAPAAPAPAAPAPAAPAAPVPAPATPAPTPAS